jgi:Ni,Fe-hydrogenase maturation factor
VSALEQVAPWARFRAVQQLTPELAEDIAAASLVVFVDASVAATALTVTPITPTPMTSGSHLTTAGALLHLTEMMYGRRAGAALQVEIPAHELGFGEELSPRTGIWVERAIAHIAAHIASEDGVPVTQRVAP